MRQRIQLHLLLILLICGGFVYRNVERKQNIFFVIFYQTKAYLRGTRTHSIYCMYNITYLLYLLDL